MPHTSIYHFLYIKIVTVITTPWESLPVVRCPYQRPITRMHLIGMADFKVKVRRSDAS